MHQNQNIQVGNRSYSTMAAITKVSNYTLMFHGRNLVQVPGGRTSFLILFTGGTSTRCNHKSCEWQLDVPRAKLRSSVQQIPNFCSWNIKMLFVNLVIATCRLNSFGKLDTGTTNRKFQDISEYHNFQHESSKNVELDRAYKSKHYINKLRYW